VKSGAPAEYKQVTVLFADVVRSMDLAAAVGAEQLREIMTELVTVATKVVQRYGGTVDKFTGDGIMAIFGAPTALEDHAPAAAAARSPGPGPRQRRGLRGFPQSLPRHCANPWLRRTYRPGQRHGLTSRGGTPAVAAC
jgi:class 3 adenylate cyclase